MCRSCPQLISHQVILPVLLGWWVAVIFRDSLSTNLTSSTTFTFDHSSYELVQVSLTLQNKALLFFCLYRPPPSCKNKVTKSMFPDQVSDLLDHCNSLPGDLCFPGGFNIHFDLPCNPTMTKLLDLLRMFNLHQTVK